MVIVDSSANSLNLSNACDVNCSNKFEAKKRILNEPRKVAPLETPTNVDTIMTMLRRAWKKCELDKAEIN